MAYVLTSFDGLSIPTTIGDNAIEIAGGPIVAPVITLPGRGVYDPLGSQVALSAARELVATVLLNGATSSAVQTTLNSWLAKSGRRGTLLRTGEDSTVHQILARCHVPAVPRRGGQLLVLPLELRFALLESIWSGQTETDTTESNLAASDSFTVANSGNETVRAVTLTFTAGSTVSALTVTNSTSGHTWSWAGTLTASQTLVVNTGALSVVRAGSNAYSEFTAPTNKPEWFAVNAGNNTIDVTITETAVGSSSLRVQFYPGWA